MNRKSIRIGLFQYDIAWNDISKNQETIVKQLNSIDKKPDILVLPEMYTTGFTMNAKKLSSEQIQNQLVWQQSISEEYDLAILGSTIMLDGESFKNRILYTLPGSEQDFYDKRHLFRFEKEDQSIECGTERRFFNFNTIKIMPQICYDLRFPVWSRNDIGYHILIYVANWPAVRRVVWDTLLRARAIENQCYVIGVNRTGRDENPIDYDGGSAVYGPKGEQYLQMNDADGYADVELSISELVEFRDKFGAYKDADSYEIKNPELPPPGFVYD